MMIHFVTKVVGNVSGILCQDGKFRSHFTYSTYPEGVKVYTKFGWAIRKADRINGDTVSLNPETHELGAYGIPRKL